MKISLKAARVNANITMADAAKYINRAVMTLSRWETGGTDIPAADFKKLCLLYNVDEREVFLPIKMSKGE